MSNGPNILDIVIRWRSEGKSDQEISDRLQKMGVAAEDTAKALGKVGDETKKTEDAQKTATKETEKATSAKQKFREQLRGLAFEFPIVARAVALLTNPITAVITLFGILAAKFQEAGQKALGLQLMNRQLELLGERTRSLAELRDGVAEWTQSIVDGFEKAETASQRLLKSQNELNASFLFQQQLAEDLNDDITQLALAQIDASGKSDAVKNVERAGVMRAARQRKTGAQEETLRRAADVEFTTAGKASADAFNLRQKAAGMDTGIVAAQDAAQTAAAGLASAEQFVGGTLGADGRVAATAGGALDQINTNIANTRLGIQQGGMLDPRNPLVFQSVETLRNYEQQYIEQYKDLENTLKEAAKVASDAAAAAKAAQDAKEKLLQEAGASDALSRDAFGRANAGTDRLNQFRANAGRRNAVISQTEDTQMRTALVTGFAGQIRQGAVSGGPAGAQAIANELIATNAQFTEIILEALKRVIAQLEAAGVKVNSAAARIGRP